MIDKIIPIMIKIIEIIRRFISSGNLGKLFVSVFQGHRLIDEPSINPTNIIRILSLDFFNNHFKIGMRIISPVMPPKKKKIR